MEWVRVIEQVGLGGTALIGLIIIVREILNRTKKTQNNDIVFMRIILEKQNHISDNLREISEKLERVSENLNKIITRLEVLSTKVNGYARNRN